MGRYLEKVRALERALTQSMVATPGSPPGGNELNELNEIRADTPLRGKHFPERHVGDGQLPPLDRPPKTREELARLIDHLADPVAFADWLQALMEQVDPAEVDRE